MGKVALIAVSVAAMFIAVPGRNASAGMADTIRDDLRPVSGYVVMQQGNDYLVDLDARHGLRVGDLLSVVTRGQEVVHPVTKEVLGRLDEAKAVLQVTQMKSGFSVARPVSDPAKIAKGDIVRRFAHLKAVFLGSEARDKALYAALQEALPELEWQGLFSPEEKPAGKISADMVFSRENEELRLLDRGGQRVRTWTYSSAAETVSPTPVAAPAPQPAPAVSAVPPPAVASKSPGEDLSQVRWSGGGVDYGTFTGLGELPDRVLMAAFVQDSDKVLLATVDGEKIRVYTMTGGLRLLTATRPRAGVVSPLSVSWWRPEKTGDIYIAVSAVEEITRNYATTVEKKLSSTIYRFDGQALKPVASDIKYFLGTFDRDGDGLPETLLGQEFHLSLEYGRTFALRWEGKDISADKPGFDLPREFTVPGSTMADLTGDGKQEIAMVRNGVLWIFSGTERIYSSSQDMGGSISTFTYDVNPGLANTMFRVLALEIPPVPRDIDGDGIAELLVVGSESSSVKVPGFGPGIKKSWVNVLKFHGGSFQKGRLAGERENPLQGIWTDTEKVYLVESRTTSSISREGSSTLLAHPLGKPRS